MNMHISYEHIRTMVYCTQIIVAVVR